MFTKEEIRAIAEKFELKGAFLGFSLISEGHINNTLKISCEENGKTVNYLLQEINTSVFKDSDILMSNVSAVTSFIKDKLTKNPGLSSMESLYCYPTKDGDTYYTDENGRVWRVYNFIENSVCYDFLDSEALFYKTAKGFGEYAKLLSDFPMEKLGETIPNFHHTAKRYENLLKAIEENRSGRLDLCLPEIEFVKERAEDTHKITDLLESGALPLRVTHNDTKLNNILFSKTTNEPICVVDLDTVMPGSSLYDFGDAIRSGAATAAEDERDLTKVRLNLDLFKAYVEGYLSAAGDGLTETEISLLPFGAKLITLECGMRFLTDFLDGDVYFRTSYPEHNLVRCRTQLKLVEEMEKHAPEMEEIVNRAQREGRSAKGL